MSTYDAKKIGFFTLLYLEHLRFGFVLELGEKQGRNVLANQGKTVSVGLKPS
jgi:hypothetical protein